MSIYKTIKLEDLTAEIVFDHDVQNPRADWEQATTMVCFHRNYRLGDVHGFSDPSELQEFVQAPNVISLPLFLYDHSGITISTSPFNCRWDSGQVGYIYMTADQIRQHWGWKRITKARRQTVIDYLIADVKVYDQYLTGDVYGYVIRDQDGEELDSCWGYYGTDSVEQEATAQLTYWDSEKPKQFQLEL